MILTHPNSIPFVIDGLAQGTAYHSRIQLPGWDSTQLEFPFIIRRDVIVKKNLVVIRPDRGN
jgi:hypothetical protein